MIINVALSAFLLALSWFVFKISMAIYKEPIINENVMNFKVKVVFLLILLITVTLLLFNICVILDNGLVSVQYRFGGSGYGPYSFSLIGLLMSIAIFLSCLVVKLIRLPH
jgi:hypothetical protein